MSTAILTSTEALTPVQPEERIVVLDVLRGFALLGILAVNLPGAAASGYAWAAGLDPFPPWWDKTAEWIVNTFFSGKFNSIFSFLFGLGFTIQLTRAAERGANVTAVYLRRIGILFALGVAHSVLIWNGDVLHIYAVLGLLLLAIRRASDKAVFTLILLAVLLPGARAAYSAITREPWPIPPSAMSARYTEETRIYQSGTYAAQVKLRYEQTVEFYGFIRQLRGFVMFYFSLLITMLFGFYVGRKRIIQELPLAVVGRMPLTNYLAQSVIFTTLLYSWGLGFYGRFGPAACLALTAVIFTVQVPYSRWWMARFRFGPLEWLWRAATYGHFPQLRATPAAAAGAVART